MSLTFSQISTALTWIIIWGFVYYVKQSRKNDADPIFTGNPSKASSVGIFIFFILFYALLWTPVALDSLMSVQWTLAVIFLGYILLLGGLALALWTAKSLGKLWTVTTAVASNYQITQTGPYAYLRHPMYLAQILIWLGSSLVFINPLGLLAGIILIPMLLIRIHTEEKNLLSVYGPAYQDYKNRVGGLFLKI